MLTKAISCGPDHRGCSCLFIVHHHCLHGSDAPESIAALEQTSEQQTVEAGKGVNYYRRTEQKYKCQEGGKGIGGDGIITNGLMITWLGAANFWLLKFTFQPVVSTYIVENIYLQAQ